MDKEQKIFFEMVRAALTGSEPPDCHDWKSVMRLARKHKMVNIIAELSSRYPDIPDELLAEK